MPAPSTAPYCPPSQTLDDLELLRAGLLPVSPASPVRLALPGAPCGPGTVQLVDPEGVPLATVPAPDESGVSVLTGSPHWQGRLSARPFEQLYAPPSEVPGEYPVAVVVGRPLGPGDLRDAGGPILLLVPAGPSIEPDTDAAARLRSAVAAAAARPGTRVVALPLSLARGGSEPDLLAHVIQRYAPGADVRHLEPGTATTAEPHGTVLFFSGLSGSGKSTIARAVRNAAMERGGLPVTMLDGDVVRRNLSAGLGFSPKDRDTNIRRIGWVAAQIAHHGGLVICSPIAPYDATRKQVRRMAADRGAAFVLVYVATPVAECERRDRKGLYAKARAGEIRDFTGISAPYEQPGDADLVIDTTGVSVQEARDRVLDLLARRDLLPHPMS